jgi:DNA-directed RNA polymerase specialized sigma24 family protein
MTRSQTTAWPSSPLAAVTTAFTALTTEPAPLTLDAAALTGGPAGDQDQPPAGPQPLPALRAWMLDHPRAYTTRDAVWRELATRARAGDPAWTVAAVGMALPALTRFAGRLATGYRGDPDDLDAELITGFLQALHDRADLAAPGLYAKLCYAAWRAARAARLADETYLPIDDLDLATTNRPPRLPYGHPDLLIARATALGIVTPDDAALFVEVRLAHRALAPAAARAGLTPDAARMRLNRAATRLANALTSGQLSGVVSPAIPAATAARGRGQG